MRSIERDIKVVVDPTPVEIAHVFASMDADQQAEFLTELALITEEWKAPFCFQVHSIVDSKKFTEDARSVMATFGEYAAVAHRPVITTTIIETHDC